MKSTLLATTFLALAATAASAADITDVAPTTDWTGAYVGAFGGYAWGSADVDAGIDSPDPDLDSLSVSGDLDGFLGGIQAGYDYDFGTGFVLGAVADFAFSGVESDTVCLEGYTVECDDNGPDHAEGQTSMDWLATVRARAGFGMGDALIYATGGVAFADLSIDVKNLDGDGDRYSDSETRTGWTAGGGIEYRVTENVSIGAEYLYVDLGSVETEYEFAGGLVNIDAETEVNMSIVKGSVNLRF
jgi:outer membrane immunogenic protein